MHNNSYNIHNEGWSNLRPTIKMKKKELLLALVGQPSPRMIYLCAKVSEHFAEHDGMVHGSFFCSSYTSSVQREQNDGAVQTVVDLKTLTLIEPGVLFGSIFLCVHCLSSPSCRCSTIILNSQADWCCCHVANLNGIGRKVHLKYKTQYTEAEHMLGVIGKSIQYSSP